VKAVTEMNYLALCVGTLLIGGCSRHLTSPAPATQAAQRAAHSPTTQPILQEISVRYGIYLAGIEDTTTITPTGLLRSVRIMGKSYGPGDGVARAGIGPQVEVRQGQLTEKQMEELARLFIGWGSLSDKYGTVADGPEVEFRYGEKRIEGGSALPKQVWDAYHTIKTLAESMPRLDPTTQKAPKSSPDARMH
jgi:hypothetical protein